MKQSDNGFLVAQFDDETVETGIPNLMLEDLQPKVASKAIHVMLSCVQFCCGLWCPLSFVDIAGRCCDSSCL